MQHLVQGDQNPTSRHCWLVWMHANRLHGDDTIDLPVMQGLWPRHRRCRCHPLVLARPDLVTRLAGGVGACARVCDLILQAQGLG